MFRPVGYLIRTKAGPQGERGQFYDYVLAGNGVWIEAEGPFFAARVPVAAAEIRGLAPLEPVLVLRHGPIPQYLFDLALGTMMADTSRERYVAVTWNDDYHLHVPEQDADAASTHYVAVDNTVLDLHSHGTMAARFSTTDDRDELGLKVFGVLGRLADRPELRLRVGVYGYYHPVAWGEVFAGTLDGVNDLLGREPDEDDDSDCRGP